MSTVIKANDATRPIQGVAFNFDDMTAKANEYLEKVRGEAAKMIADAKQEVDRIRQAATSDSEKAGFEAGHKRGMQQIEEITAKKLAAQLTTLLPAMKAVIQDIEHAKQAWLAHWEKSGIHVATAIAGRLVRREIAQSPEITLTLLREALELSAGSAQMRIHLNDADYKALEPQVQAMVKELAGLASAEFISDPDVTPGGCRIETAFGVVDNRIESQLNRIEEELTQ